VKRPLLVLAAVLGGLSAVALMTTAFFLESPIASNQANGIFFLGLVDLAIAGLLLVGGFRESRIAAVIVPVVALVGSGGLALMFGGMQLETELSFIQGTRTTQAVLFFGAFLGNALVILAIVLNLMFGLRRGRKALISGA
jgi:hypothetical protein